MKKITKAWKVYGKEGHRQKHSFGKSYVHRIEERNIILEVFNSDKTGTNDYSILIITGETEKLCEDEFWGQVDDGVFENCNVGKIKEITIEELLFESYFEEKIEELLDYTIYTIGSAAEETSKNIEEHLSDYIGDWYEGLNFDLNENLKEYMVKEVEKRYIELS